MIGRALSPRRDHIADASWKLRQSSVLIRSRRWRHRALSEGSFLCGLFAGEVSCLLAEMSCRNGEAKSPANRKTRDADSLLEYRCSHNMSFPDRPYFVADASLRFRPQLSSRSVARP